MVLLLVAQEALGMDGLTETGESKQNTNNFVLIAAAMRIDLFD